MGTRVYVCYLLAKATCVAGVGSLREAISHKKKKQETVELSKGKDFFQFSLAYDSGFFLTPVVSATITVYIGA